MPNPYDSLDEKFFWKKAVAESRADAIFPTSAKGFQLHPTDQVATAGSCFAQNVGKYLRQSPAVRLIETEALGPEDPVFSGRYGNIYTPRQLHELLDECETGIADPACAIQRHDGRFVDVFRPFIVKAGFTCAADVVAARQAHITAIRPVFHDADLFVFTLGLTEAWYADTPSGRTYPVCPGIYADDRAHPYAFRNFGFADIQADMARFIARLTAVNPGVKILLTVSPVPLTATYSHDHILTATMYSKSILRTVCGELAAGTANVYYFPSYEMVANPYTAGSAYEANLRTVRPAVVQSIMEFFAAEYITAQALVPHTAVKAETVVQPVADATQGSLDELICDDIQIEKSVGF